jgi:transcriptional regulatory protein RtcR
VVIGVLGTVMDKRGKRANRFRKWRPTVGLCQQPDFPVDRLELLHQPRDLGMAQQLAEDIVLVSPHRGAPSTVRLKIRGILKRFTPRFSISPPSTL